MRGVLGGFAIDLAIVLLLVDSRVLANGEDGALWDVIELIDIDWRTLKA